MLPRIYSFLGRCLHFRAKFLIKEGFLVPYRGFCCGNGGICCRERGGFIAERERRCYGEIGACPWHLTSQAEPQKRKPHAVRRLVWFSPLLSEKRLSFFVKCISFFEKCIRCYSKSPLKLGIIFEEPFRDLHRIEGSSLFDLVAHQPEGEASGVGQVFADATHKHVVATFEQEGHRIFAR